jgi:hypothetical protein
VREEVPEKQFAEFSGGLHFDNEVLGRVRDALQRTMRTNDASMRRQQRKRHQSENCFYGSHIRRTAETLLASKGISRDIRAQIQSHGLSGVQVRHYDRHDYRDPRCKTAHIEFLAALLHGRHEAKVVPLQSQVA